MYFDSLDAAFAMDGHGGFVWAAYAISVLVLFLILLVPHRRQKNTLLRLAGEQKRQKGSPTTGIVEEGE